MRRSFILASLVLALSLFTFGAANAATWGDGIAPNTGSAPDYWYTIDFEDESTQGQVPASLTTSSAIDAKSNPIFEVNQERKLFITRTSEGVAEHEITRINICKESLAGENVITCLQSGPEALMVYRYFSDDWEFCEPEERIGFVYIPGDGYSKPSPTTSIGKSLRWAKSFDCSVSIGVIRSGYYDKNNYYSSGWDGETRYDNYGPYVVDSIASGLMAFKDHYNLSNLVVIGKSGGGNIGSQVLNRFPDLAQGGYFYGPSCDYRTWASDRNFSKNKSSPSPIEHLANIRRGTFVWFVDGDEDEVTGVKYSQNCVNKLVEEYGHDPEYVKMIVLPGETHDFRSKLSLPFLRKIVKGIFTTSTSTSAVQAAK